MSGSFADIGANPQQHGFSPMNEGSKIPGPSKVRRSRSSGHRSPFSVSTTGSPCYIASSASSKPIVSPAIMSKLPRKSTPTQNGFSESYMYGSRPVKPRSGLPRARGGSKPTAIAVPSNPNTSQTTLSLSCNKPLPSPPIAQIVNPASPLKAQRTLVDAEAGTPTGEQWPILRPENVSPSKFSALPTKIGAVQRSVSEATALRCNDVAVLWSQNITPSPFNNRTPSEKSEFSTRDKAISHEKFRQSTEMHSLNSVNVSTQSFQAFSTNIKVAVDSPLTDEQPRSPDVIIPPRTSSKRAFLPLPGTTADDLPSQPVSAAFRSAKPGSTKWPVLVDATKRSHFQCINQKDYSNIRRRLVAEPEPVEPASFGDAGKPQSRYGSIDSISTRSLPAECSLDDELEACYEGGVRIKRLPCHSSNNGLGPTLRIFADANALILGRDDFIPALPAFSEEKLEHNARDRSIGTLTARVTKQKLVKMSSTAVSRTSSPTPTETELAESKPVRFTPTRSMQPPGGFITEDFHRKSALSSLEASLDATRDEGALLSPQLEPCSSFETFQERTFSQLQSGAMHRGWNEDQMDCHESGKYSTTLPHGVSQKPIQASFTESGSSQPAASKFLPSMGLTPVSAGSKSEVTRMNTSPILRSSDRLKAQVPRSSSHSSSKASERLLGAIPSRAGVHQHGLYRLGRAELVVHDLDASLCKSITADTEAGQQFKAENAPKMRKKHSFRNIFHRCDLKATPQPTKKRESKRSSITRSALALRIRKSTNFSKVVLSRPSEPSPEIEFDGIVLSDSAEEQGRLNECHAALLASEVASTMRPPEPEPTVEYDTATVIHKFLDRVTPMEEEFPARLRGLEIAETMQAILHTVDCSKKANMSYELAKKYARDAELNAERAEIELKRLARLCEPKFGDETMQLIKQLITEAGARKLSEIRAK